MGPLPQEYFDLVRQAVKEGKQTPRRKRRRLPKYESNDISRPADVIINLDSDTDNETKFTSEGLSKSFESQSNRDLDDDNEKGSNNGGDDDDDDDDDDEFNSDDFEDVSDADVSEQTSNAELSITLNPQKPQKKTGSKNLVSNEERKYRRYFHLLHLVTLLVHGYVRNQWLNDAKLHQKLSKLVPDNVFELLHPKRDDELPLRSTRKLLDGLKRCMEIWWKHFDQITRWETPGLYMMDWDELDGPWEQPTRYMSQKLFNKKVAHGKGSSEIAAQGFVAMLRACGVNARLIMNAQPPDFTNNKVSARGSLKTPGEYLDKTDMRPKRRKKAKGGQRDPDAKRHVLFWCEVWDKVSKKWITVDPMGQRTIEQIRYKTALDPQGSAKRNNLFRYIIAYDRKLGCRDVTRRYTTHFNSKTRKRRITRDAEGEEWMKRVLARLHQRKRTRTDDFEDAYFRQRDETEGIPDNMQDLKNHPYYVLQNDFKWNEVLKSGCKECGFLRTKNNTSLKVYRREDVLVLKTARTWYTEGRVLKPGASALKTTKSRDFKTGEATEERLYAFDETELFIPEDLGPNNEVPTNVYGNIDIYTSSMIPRGSCLIESPVAVKAAACLGIEFAKAVTGFKFEKKRVAKPQITGIVVSQEYREAVESMIDGVEYSLEEDERQERELEALQHWNLFLAKLRIKQRLNTTHGKVSSATVSTWDDNEPDQSDTSDGVGVGSDEKTFEGGGFVPEAAGFVPEAGEHIPAVSDHELNEDSIVEGGFLQGEDENEGMTAEAVVSEDEAENLTFGNTDDNLEARNTSQSLEEGGPRSTTVDDEYEDFMNNMLGESDVESAAQDDSDFEYESE